MDQLPFEILNCIISHLDQHDLSKLTMVSRIYRKNLLARLFVEPLLTSLSALAKFGESAQCLGFETMIETMDLSNIPRRWQAFSNAHLKVLLSSTANLKNLNLSYCSCLTNESIKLISKCKYLECLNLSKCVRITSLTTLGSCTNIYSLDVSCCFKLKDFNGIYQLTNLEFLNVSGTKLTDDNLLKMFDLSKLKEIDISGCYNIVDATDLNKPVNLLIISDSLDPGQVEWDDTDADSVAFFTNE